MDANREILRRAGYPFDNTWMFEAITDTQANAIWDLEPEPSDVSLAQMYGAQSPWVWKDPRLCFTLGYWWKILDPSEHRGPVAHKRRGRDPAELRTCEVERERRSAPLGEVRCTPYRPSAAGG